MVESSIEGSGDYLAEEGADHLINVNPAHKRPLLAWLMDRPSPVGNHLVLEH
ncbi:hypothetical protein [Dyella sp. A6]|uniref:hypothetical protein n=1 Tax=Dyella aluminiiresistens TaxID=3069105 RepID=UPI002E784CEA|nr:hypothetical protein [Dyella sp. A6]